MIDGIGVDIVEIERIKNIYKKFGEKFLQKILTKNEILYCKSKKNFLESIAIRFAAKEAFFKAFQNENKIKFGWREIEIVRNEKIKKMEIKLKKNLNKSFSKKKVFVSLSHSNTSAVALVIIENLF